MRDRRTSLTLARPAATIDKSIQKSSLEERFRRVVKDKTALQKFGSPGQQLRNLQLSKLTAPKSDKVPVV